jgi:hypothetical protein
MNLIILQSGERRSAAGRGRKEGRELCRNIVFILDTQLWVYRDPEGPGNLWILRKILQLEWAVNGKLPANVDIKNNTNDNQES